MSTRREFLTQAALASGSLGLAAAVPQWLHAATMPVTPFFKISLAEWSLHKALFGGKMTNLDFPAMARNSFGVEGVEFVNQFFKDKAKDMAYLTDLKKRCDDNGVRAVLIMIDDEGGLGDVDKKARQTAVENHYKWVDAAHFLGCHSIRVNAFGKGTEEEVAKAATAGLHDLGAYAAKAGLNVIVENHGGYSSNGKWLGKVIKKTKLSNVGTLPDFGNFCVRREGGQMWDGKCVEQYDPYLGVEEMMPFAKGVSAKTFEFNADGSETTIDYLRMMKIVKQAGYKSFVGIEYEGNKHSEEEGIKLTKTLLEKVAATLG
jgi:sugar phosphate isomerase/epimerase